MIALLASVLIATTATPAEIVSRYDNDGYATLRFQDPKPTIVSPTAEDTFSFADQSCTIPVVIMDSYHDMSAPRTYTVQVLASGSTLCSSNSVAFRSGESVGLVLDEAILQRLQGSWHAG